MDFGKFFGRADIYYDFAIVAFNDFFARDCGGASRENNCGKGGQKYGAYVFHDGIMTNRKGRCREVLVFLRRI